MKQAPITVLFLALLAVLPSCLGVGGYDLVVGEGCYAPHHPPAMAGWGGNLPYYMETGEDLEYQGTYAVEPNGQAGLVRQFDRQRGWSYVTLGGVLPVDEGTLLEIQGRVVSHQVAGRSAGSVRTVKQVQADSHRVICNTGPFQERAGREYRMIRGKLQDAISLPGSKLQLGAEPEWRVDWLRGEETIVVAGHFYDLMYAAEVQFLFTIKDQKLKTVYFQEWFKGE